uniref:Uncharacterized protein n=1 Tax=Clytia hemisphaerica TaxID=252671 RepID=A0A7M5XAN7_9CNID|eukprot:TCONS_00052428-protein
MECKTLILLVFAAGTFVLLGASAGGDDWFINATVRNGLWRYCVKVLDVCVTRDWDDISTKLHAIRAFAVLSVLFAGFGALVSLVRLFKDMDGKSVSALFLGAGICMLIAVSIYTDDSRKLVEFLDSASYGWSFIFGWIGTIFSFLVSALAVCLK